MATTLLPLPTARAGSANRETLARPGSAESTPPDFPDAIHVPEGCYISTVAYLAKFTAAFPGEFATPLTIRPKKYLGPHTVALVSWRNQWWLRDEFLGVLRLNQAVVDAGAADRLRSKAQATLERRATRISDAAREQVSKLAARIAGGVDPTREVATAAKLLPFPTEQFHLKCRDREIALLFFRPGVGRIAVYDPLTGTATADTTASNTVTIVEVVAARLGYKIDPVRRALSAPAPTLIAATGSGPVR